MYTYNQSKRMKALNIFLLVLIIVGVILLFTQDKWVPKVVNYLLGSQVDNKVEYIDSKWTNKITAVDDSCADDGVCTMTIGGVKVITTIGKMTGYETEPLGQIIGLDGSYRKQIGKTANVYARKISNTEFTLYGNENFFIEIIK